MSNKNEMVLFHNEEFGNVRVVKIGDEAWLAGKDVVEALGYNLSGKHVASEYIKAHCEPEDYVLLDKNVQFKQGVSFNYKELGQRGGYLVNETGLLKLITHNEIISIKQRENIINFFKNFGMLNGVVFNSRKEIEFIDKLERALLAFNITGNKQHNVLDYRIDYYIPSLNVAIEYDENGHRDYTYEAHELRQELIQKELGCRFIRVTDEKNDEFNIGLVIKELFNIK